MYGNLIFIEFLLIIQYSSFLLQTEFKNIGISKTELKKLLNITLIQLAHYLVFLKEVRLTTE